MQGFHEYQKLFRLHNLSEVIQLKRSSADPRTVLEAVKNKEICSNFSDTRTLCPMRHHKGNGKVRMLSRTSNEIFAVIHFLNHICTSTKSSWKKRVFSKFIVGMKDVEKVLINLESLS